MFQKYSLTDTHKESTDIKGCKDMGTDAGADARAGAGAGAGAVAAATAVKLDSLVGVEWREHMRTE